MQLSRRLGAELASQRLDVVLGDDVAAGDGCPSLLDLAHSRRIREDRLGLFDGLQIVCAEQNSDRTSVAGDGDTFLGGDDFVDDL